jgi:hypothetical protein
MAYMFSSYRLPKKPLKAELVGVEKKIQEIYSNVRLRGTAGHPNIRRGGYMIWAEAPDTFRNIAFTEKRKKIRNLIGNSLVHKTRAKSQKRKVQ